MFPEYTLTLVPRSQNIIADSLATVASNLKISMNSSNKFEIHVKHRPSVLDNLRYWNFFGMTKKLIAFCRMMFSSKMLLLMMFVILMIKT